MGQQQQVNLLLDTTLSLLLKVLFKLLKDALLMLEEGQKTVNTPLCISFASLETDLSSMHQEVCFKLTLSRISANNQCH